MRTAPLGSLILLAACLCGCVAPGGSLHLSATFAHRFGVQAIPATTSVIRLAVTPADGLRRTASLSAASPTLVLSGLPIGDVTVMAGAFDADDNPLAGAQGTALILGGQRVSVTLDLQAGAIDPSLLTKADPSPKPTTEVPPTPAVPTSDPGAAAPASAAPLPSAAAASVPPSVTPTVSSVASGGGGGDSPAPTLSPVPPAGSTTVVTGQAYSGNAVVGGP